MTYGVMPNNESHDFTEMEQSLTQAIVGTGRAIVVNSDSE